MKNPYQLDPEALRNRPKSAQETRLVALRDDIGFTRVC
jgi:hypothetical protein